jgi:hypothetical protein
MPQSPTLPAKWRGAQHYERHPKVHLNRRYEGKIKILEYEFEMFDLFLWSIGEL